MAGLFVTGTDTGVGKTVVAAAIAAALRARGRSTAAHKPVVTGLDDAPVPGWPPDHELLAATTGQAPETVAPRRFGPAVSPHLAAELAGEALRLGELVAAARAAGEQGAALVVEGVGGLLVPLAGDGLVRDFAVALGLPLVVVGRPGLGTINHTLLTLEAARGAGLRVAGVVLTPWPSEPDRLERSNRATIARLGGVEVAGLPRVARAGPARGAPGEPALLAAAGAELPLEAWLADA